MTQYTGDDDEEEQWDEQPVFEPTTHYIAPFWKWFLTLMSPMLAVLMAAAIALIIGDYRAGRGWENAWLLAFILATLAGLVLLALAGLVMAWRSRIVLTADQMTLRGLLRTRSITPEMMEGYRLNNGQLFLFLRGKQWPINLAYFDQQHVLFGWVSYYVPDLNAQELIKDAHSLSLDEALGANEQQRAARLARLRTTTRALNWLGYIAAVGGFLGAMSFVDAAILQLAIPMLVVLPALMLWLALHYRGLVRLDYKEGMPHPELLTGWMACSLSLGMIALLDPHTLLGDALLQWLLPLVALASAMCIYIELKPLRALLAKQWLHAVLAVCSYVFLASFWVGGSVYQINQQLDRSLVRWNLTVVVGKRSESQKTGTAYYLKVAPWDGLSREDIALQVPRSDYDTFAKGMPILIGVHEGALQMPWVETVRAVQ